MRISTGLFVLAWHTMQGEGDAMMNLGKLIRLSGTAKVYCTGQAHIRLAHTGSWQKVDVYLKTDHANCVPLQHQKPLAQEVTP